MLGKVLGPLVNWGASKPKDAALKTLKVCRSKAA